MLGNELNGNAYQGYGNEQALNIYYRTQMTLLFDVLEAMC